MKSRLRHPIRAIREPFGTAGLMVAIVALVFAMVGGAYAASALTGKQRKEVEKIAKKYAGKDGAPGAPGSNGSNGKDGANGTNGANGEKGAKGDPGTNGTDGTPGTNGADGKSVEAFPSNGLTGEACEGTGGAEYEVEGEPSSAVEICNGKKGDNGKEGSPWTAGGTLPVGATETGTWYVTGTTGGSPGVFYAPLSFPIPLASNVKTGHFFFGTGSESEIEVSPGVFEKTEFQKHCPAVSFVGPTAANAGELCLYLDETDNTTGAVFEGVRRIVASATSGANRAGGLLELKFPENVSGFVTGSFAVKGCSTTLPVGDPDKCP